MGDQSWGEVTEKTKNLHDQVKAETSHLSFNDLNVVTRHVKGASPSLPVTERQEEVVKFMSKLPSYLQTGQNQSDNVLNFGVLDWSRLEQWQHNQTMIQRSNVPSNGVNGCSSSCRTRNRPSLHHHLMSSSADFHVKSSNTSSGENEEIQRRIKTSQEEKFVSEKKFRKDSREYGSQAVSGASSTGSNVPNFFRGNSEARNKEHKSSKSNHSQESSSLQIRDSSASKSNGEKRSTSPFRRLGIGMSKIGKIFVAKDGLSASQPTMDYADGSVNHENSRNRRRSSPLRRLIDPLLKQKMPSFHYHEQTSKDDNLSSNSGYRMNKNTMQQEAERADGYVSVETRKKSTHFQALLRVTDKNGQTLFTFAVDNEPEILAATVKKLPSSSINDKYSCMFTFFSIQEIKKKSGRWINQGEKHTQHDYVQNVVGQLKVSSSQFSCKNEDGHLNMSFSKRFVLLDVEIRDSDEQMLDFHPNSELAAIVLKISKDINPKTSKNLHQFGGESCRIMKNQNFFKATVILPNGIHSLPNKGEPSSLIQRWKTGGSCDCGGWDMSCKLNIFSNCRNCDLKSSSNPENKFELFFESGEEAQTPFFSMSPFKDGIYSVEFSLSFTIMQAFSISIAVLDGKKVSEDPF